MWTLVTGGAKRLGEAICLALAEKGHSVVVHYHTSQKEALAVVAKCRSFGRDADLIQGDFNTLQSLQDFIKRYLEKFPNTSVLINNVGEYLVRSALQTSIEDWIHLFQVNLHAPFFLTQSLISSIIQSKGQIINIGASGLQRQIANTYSSAYTLTKEGLWGLTLAFARELAPQGVRVNMVSPGQLDISVDHYPIPMQRVAYCWEVCRVISFLLDSESSYITGQNIEIAGGLGLA